MSVATKLEYLNDTKQLLKENINNLGGNLTNEPFRQYASVLEGIYESLPKVSGIGASLSLSPSLIGKIKLNEIQGNTLQDGTPTPDTPVPIQSVTGNQNVTICGKNLFDTSNAESRTHNGITFTLNNDGSIKANGTASSLAFMLVLSQEQSPLYKAGNYAFSLSNEMPNNCYVRFEFYDSNNTMILRKDITTNGTATLLQNCYLKVSYVIASGTVLNNFVNYIQIEKGSTATTYEPYKGNTYEVNLGNIELNKTGTYEDSIKKSTGKNLFDYNSFETFTTTIQYVSLNLKPSTTYTMSSNLPVTSGVGSNVFFMKDGETASTSSNGIKPNEPRTLTTDSTGIVKIGYRTNSNITGNPKTDYYYQIEENSQATTYEPYGKVWYITENIGKVQLSNDWNWGTQGTTNFQVTLTGVNKLGLAMSSTGLSNYFRVSSSGNDIFMYPILQGSTDYIRIANAINKWETTTDFKTWLLNNPTFLYYPLATPTYTEITNTELIEQLESLNNAKSEDGTTNINVDGSLPVILGVKVLKGE